ncbi:hypothetical protein I8752_26825 [Nostocaceae cyanobacterium CENA369]|uniref:Uncharacterized protein n=1 Tax=Dendronalium phyllosphericum CENA369 TaxID=1725256 RepID=A0A8J7I5U1_9NOST|nr:hypothetical protein [Dendronalium phyllosphericum]MBH8576540.1 hypothetical protein [Dendronalium phyllosphericum CENA369]
MVGKNDETDQKHLPLDIKRRQFLQDWALLVQGQERFELFKSSKQFDADEGRIQHGFPPQSQMAT